MANTHSKMRLRSAASVTSALARATSWLACSGATASFATASLASSAYEWHTVSLCHGSAGISSAWQWGLFASRVLENEDRIICQLFAEQIHYYFDRRPLFVKLSGS